MKVKTYRAATTKAALEQIKQELGADAFILGQKEVRPARLLRVFLKSYVEVIAAVDYSERKLAALEREPDAVDMISDRVELSGGLINAPPDSKLTAATKVSTEPAAGNQLLLNEIHKLTLMVQSISSTRPPETVPLKRRRFSEPGARRFYADLVGRGIEENLASELVSAIGSFSASDVEIHAEIVSVLSGRIQIYPDLVRAEANRKPRVVALLGPTGVGKTTTLAKLAARAALQERLKVGLVTLDTFRIAAIEQLKTYSEIMGLPIRVAENVKELKTAIQSFADRDLVLVDTAGHSQHELSNQWELAEFLSESADIEKALVLSATTKQSDLKTVVDRYDMFGIDCLIFTKLDETGIHGPVINELLRSKKPLACVTTGQRVPQDIHQPDAVRISEFVLEPNQSQRSQLFANFIRVPESLPEDAPAAMSATQ